MNFVTDTKLRAYCMQDLGQYINGAEYDGMRRFLSKSHKGEPLGRMEHERQRANQLIQAQDLEPRENSAAHLLAIISNYRIKTWLREPIPPHGHEQSLPLEKTESDALVRQTSESVEAYANDKPEREATALKASWEAGFYTLKQEPSI